MMDLWFPGIINDTFSKTTKAGFQLKGNFKKRNVFPFKEISDDVRIQADGEFIKQ
jgi:hypothetical protein